MILKDLSALFSVFRNELTDSKGLTRFVFFKGIGKPLLEGWVQLFATCRYPAVTTGNASIFRPCGAADSAAATGCGGLQNSIPSHSFLLPAPAA